MHTHEKIRLRIYQLAQASLKVLLLEGPISFSERLWLWFKGERRYHGKENLAILEPHDMQYDYPTWIELFETRELLEAQSKASKFQERPLLSIIMPVYNTEARFLHQAIGSIQTQAYPNWELCICNDGSTEPHIQPLLDHYALQDPRIKIKHLSTNSGTIAASNTALSLCSGEFVALVDHDDQLPPHALYYVIKHLDSYPEADLIYTDEDKIDIDGRRYDPFFKPDWSPDLFLSTNYFNHLTVIRTRLIEKIGGFRPGYEGGQDYDLYLRIIERTHHIHHISKILYHWRAAPTSTASGRGNKEVVKKAAQKALTDYLQRQAIDAEVLSGHSPGRWRIKYTLNRHPQVDIIILTTKVAHLRQWIIPGLRHNTRYPNFTPIIVDNSQNDEVSDFSPFIQETFPKAQYVDYRGHPFNPSRLNNQAVERSQAPILLFLNDNVVPISPDWLEAMLEHIQRPEIGAVGAKLLYPDRTIQHAGIVLGIYQSYAKAFKYISADEHTPYYFDFPHVIRNYSAVSGACLMTRREVFAEVGGFDDIHLPANFQDVDLCLKICKQGYRVAYTPYAKLACHESKSKNRTFHPYEEHYFQQKWGPIIAYDPFYNPNLTRYCEDFSL